MDHLLTAEELAERLRVQPDTVRLWSRTGLIPSVRINRKIVRFEYEDVLRSLRKDATDRHARSSGAAGGER